MPKSLTHEILKEVGRKAVRLANTLSWKKTKERWLHGVVLGLLEASIGDMQSEFLFDSSIKRIDFRHGSSNPDVIELVVRVNGGELYGSQNISELKKLCKIPYSRARRRILLLLDASYLSSIRKRDLKRTYSNLTAGKGRFTRNQVTVMYIHPETEYSFRWSPFSS